MDRAEYNLLKEAFISNLNGTSPVKVLALTHLFVLTVPVRGCLLVLLASFTALNPVKLFHLDFLFLIVPCILYTTTLGNYVLQVSILLCSLAFIIYCICGSVQKDTGTDLREVQKKLDVSLAASNCRVLLNVVTAVSILAVDFHSFPREFAKAEWYGTGLMDVGVGSFVFANSYVSRWSRGSMKKSSLLSTLKQSLVSSFSLILIGVLRMLAVALFSYHAHVTEYGVHWNFFITLSLINLAISIFSYLFNSVVFCGLLGITFAILHQYGLSHIAVFMKNENDRSTVILANLEGLVSLPGFFCLAIFGAIYGFYLFQHVQKKSFNGKFGAVTAVVSGFAFLSYILDRFVEPICRATVNLSYISWMVCYNVHMFSANHLNYIILSKILPKLPAKSVDYVFGRCASCSNRGKGARCGCLFTKISENQLLFFLLANIGTGFVNISVDTLTTGDFASVCIICVYMYITCGLLYLKNIYLSPENRKTSSSISSKLE